jgi:catechol 2,3-dioxygenase-like lactoylglutathione lyase family enzyme
LFWRACWLWALSAAEPARAADGGGPPRLQSARLEAAASRSSPGATDRRSDEVTMQPGIAIPILPARDLKETREFYERLGFLATGWWPDAFGGYAILVKGDLTMHFFSYPDLSLKENYGQCYWQVGDPDDLYSELIRTDLSAWPNTRVVPIEDKPWGAREFAMLDPSANLIRIGRPISR